MKKYIAIGVAAVVAVIIGVGFAGMVWSGHLLDQQGQTANTPTPTPTIQATAQSTSSASSSAQVEPVVQYQGVDGKTALDLLKQDYPDVQTTKTSNGEMVTSIEGRTADSNKHEYWEFMVNGKPAAEGAGTYVTKTGETLGWQIATY